MTTNQKPRQTKEVILGTGDLSLEQIVGVARFNWPVAEIGPENNNAKAQEAYDRLMNSWNWVDAAVKENEEKRKRNEKNGKGEKEELIAYYGINTGFGSKAGRIGLPKKDIPWVSRNLIVSHSTGVGDSLHPEIVRGAMLIRANSLAQGYSGVSRELVNTLVRMLNEEVCPIIPEYGSVGASGDLAPLSHLALVVSKRPGKPLTGLPDDYGDESGQAYLKLRDGDDKGDFLDIVTIDGIKYGLLSGHEAMRRRNIKPVELGPKEGLAFNNGATFSAAIAAIALYDAENVTRHAEIAGALSLEAMLGFRDAFLPPIQKIRRHSGQIESAARILKFVGDSNLLDGNINEDPRSIPPQDPYSLRVTPQVTGAVWDVLNFLHRIVEEEVNAATDNPSIIMDLPRSYKSVSGGNFHGAPLAYAMDFLGIVMTDLGSLSERRTFRLTTYDLSVKLPEMLVEDFEDTPGRTSGLMIAQYLAAGLVSDCKTLAHPDSVDSIPTSANQEDHVSMSMNAARHARKIVENIGYVVAVELLCGFIGLNWRIDDLSKRKNGDGYKDNEKKPWEKLAVDRKRLDEVVRYLHNNELSPAPGNGSKVALKIIDDLLYAGNGKLPDIGKEPTAEDRFLQPYVLRMTRLLRDGDLVTQVYESVGLELPVRA